MADVIYYLRRVPTEAEAERLVEALEHVTGVQDATLETALRRLHVTFDTRHTGDIELEGVIRREGFDIAREAEPDIATEVPGYTQRAEAQEREQQAATDLTRDQEIDLSGGLGAEAT